MMTEEKVDNIANKTGSAMRLAAQVEAIIFAAPKPIKAVEIHALIGDDRVSIEDVDTVARQLVTEYEDRFGGFQLSYVKRLGYQFRTADDAGPLMERMFAAKPRPLSRAALETLAIIAYRQPCTRAEIEFIRGVDTGGIFKTLLERDLVRCVGRKDVIGRPMLFGTTDEFLKVFQLTSLKDLPPIESFQPSTEMIEQAMKKIEGQPGEVDMDSLVNEPAPEFDGDGVSVSDSAVEPAERVRQGATAALEPKSPDAHMPDDENEDMDGIQDEKL